MKAKDVLTELKRRFPNEPEYHQAVEEVLNTIEDTYNRNIEFEKSNLIERLCIPDRIFSFRVTWTDDQGNVHTNMGLPHPAQQCYRSLQRRNPFPFLREFIYFKIPGFRADL